MTNANITSGFRATGLYPLDETVIPETAFAPSILTKRPACPEKDDSNDTFVDSRTSSPISTLLELQNLISTENLPTTPNTPDLQALQAFSPASHKSVFADKKKRSKPSWAQWFAY